MPIDEVEPVSEIVKRFSTGAMSYGSISKEAHETLAIAMNRIGARSNTGEGGEDADRYVPRRERRLAAQRDQAGRVGPLRRDERVPRERRPTCRSRWRRARSRARAASSRATRCTRGSRRRGTRRPGVGLISPPPHHDIYSIEDLKQLIHDLKNANNQARVHVKLVAEVGVGTVAAGVSKAHADVVLISGHDGGTGAARLTSIKHAGAPWELGLAETQQTLLLNGLRDRIVVQVDGQLKTGRDVVIAALLGAEEFGFATAPLVVSGCIMMRVCHLDTCPVGVATQNPELRKKFSGKPEFVVNFMEFIAEEVREHLAALGFRSLEEAIGHVELLDFRQALEHWKAQGLDLSPILAVPVNKYDQTFFCSQGPGPRSRARARQPAHRRRARRARRPVGGEARAYDIRNVNRTVGTMLGSEVTRRYGRRGPARRTPSTSPSAVRPARASARSCRAASRCGSKATPTTTSARACRAARSCCARRATATFVAEENIIAGNVILYGATGGNVFIRGVVGERFCVRNSGATAVVEGVGDHGCEYMTGGRAVILGPTGRNFAAGMSGGLRVRLGPRPARCSCA